MTLPTVKTLVQTAAALTVLGLTLSPASRAADTAPSTTPPPATTPCPNCPWGGGPGMMGPRMMGPGMMWNMTPEQREEHWLRAWNDGSRDDVRPVGRNADAGCPLSTEGITVNLLPKRRLGRAGR